MEAPCPRSRLDEFSAAATPIVQGFRPTSEAMICERKLFESRGCCTGIGFAHQLDRAQMTEYRRPSLKAPPLGAGDRWTTLGPGRGRSRIAGERPPSADNGD